MLVEGIDYYIENGLYVFTEHYLLARGYCCKNGCRHCPYGFKRQLPITEELESKACEDPKTEAIPNL